MIRFATAAVALALAATPAAADKIKNPTAVFAGLDKITGRIISFEVGIGETVQFGALQLTTRVCYSRPPTESAHTTTFVEVDEVTFTNEYRRIFTGWMFGESPGLSGIEHAIYDIWLTECKGGSEIIKEEREPEELRKGPELPEELRKAKKDQEKDKEKPKPVNVRRPGQPDQRIDVAPQAGVPVAPRTPLQRFFPTNIGRPMSINPTINDAGGSR
jgi:hypothetical protein